MDLPVYKLVINNNIEDGSEVDFISLVDKPAIMRDFIAFSEYSEKQRFQIISEERREIAGPLMIPDLPIYRESQEFGKHYVTFDAQTIKDISVKYAKKGYATNINIMHSADMVVDGVTLYQSFISDKSMGVLPLDKFSDLPDGTWFGISKVENDAVWQGVKDGQFKGYSVEGLFTYLIPKPTEEQMMAKLYDDLCGIENLLKAINTN